MRAAGVVEDDVAPDGGTGLRDAGMGPQVDLLVFDRPPQAFDEDVAPPSPFTVDLPPGNALALM